MTFTLFIVAFVIGVTLAFWDYGKDINRLMQHRKETLDMITDLVIKQKELEDINKEYLNILKDLKLFHVEQLKNPNDWRH